MKTVIDLARQAGWTGPEDNLAYITMLERFAKLVLAHNPPQSSMAWQEGYEAGKTAQRSWVGLTDEEYKEAEKVVWDVIAFDDTEEKANREFYEAIEAKLKEKNA